MVQLYGGQVALVALPSRPVRQHWHQVQRPLAALTGLRQTGPGKVAHAKWPQQRRWCGAGTLRRLLVQQARPHLPWSGELRPTEARRGGSYTPHTDFNAAR